MYPKQYADSFWRPDILDRVFVAMSFAHGRLWNWQNIIEPGIQAAGLAAYRVDAEQVSDDIVTRIMDGVLHSRLVLADITADQGSGRSNPNVTYEVGLSHALRQPEEVILVRSDTVPIIFDTSHINTHTYSLEPSEGQKMIEGLVRSALAEIDQTKSMIVARTKRALSEQGMHFLREFGDQAIFLAQGKEGFMYHHSEKAVENLLELGLAIVHPANGDADFAYEWTHLGKAVVATVRDELLNPKLRVSIGLAPSSETSL